MKIMILKFIRFIRRYRGPVLAGLALFVLFHPDLALASTDPSDAKETTEQVMASMLSMLIKFLSSLFWPVLLFIGDLMDTDMILGPGMEERLKEIWVQLRDLVNIAFVLVLLVIAFYNVLGLGGGEGELAIKKALPKVVLGLILVNFTFLGGKVVIDLTNVATAAVFGLPNLTIDDAEMKETMTEFKEQVCTKGTKIVKNETTGKEEPTTQYWQETDDAGNNSIPIQVKIFCEKNDDGQYTELKAKTIQEYFSQFNSSNIGLFMAVNFGALSDQTLLKENGIKDFSDLTVSALFSVLMFVVFATTYIVLAVVLIARIGVLWIALALSPLGVLVYVVPQIKEWAGGGGDILQKVIKHLVAPIIIGLAMSLGFIMISGWDAEVGDSALGAVKMFDTDQALSEDVLISGIDDLPQFIIAIASVIIVWVGVFAAANDTYANFITNGIKGLGEQVGGAIAKSPLLLPTIPVGIKGEGGASVSPMLLKQGLEDKLRSFEYDQMKDELDKIDKDTNGQRPGILKYLYGAGGPTGSPVQNEKEALDLARSLEGKTWDYTQAAKLAEKLAAVVARKGTPEAKKAHEDLLRLQRQYGSGDNTNFQDLQDMVAKFSERPDDYGFGETEIAQLASLIKSTNRTLTEPPKEEPDKPDDKPADGTATPAAPDHETTIDTLHGLATAADLNDHIAMLKTSDPVNAGTLTEAAQRAVATLHAERAEAATVLENHTAAVKAVNAAITAAGEAETKAATDPEKAAATAAKAQLETMRAELSKMTF